MKTKTKLALADRVALLTGAGSGIGAAAARRLAAEGARVGLLSRTAAEVKRVAKQIATAGGEALPLPADVSHPSEVSAAVKKLLRKWGRLDIVVANAGINGVWAPLEKLSIEDWDETMRINLRGTFVTLKASLAALSQRGGSVIVTASVNGTRMFSNAGASAYATTKAGQVALAKMLAVELARHRIRVNAICPGRIDTEINDNTRDRAPESLAPKVEFPEGPIPLTGHTAGASDQVAELICFLASDASDHITGAEIFIDGAQSLFQG